MNGLVGVEHEALEGGSEGEVGRQIDGGAAVEHDDGAELGVRGSGGVYVFVSVDASLVHLLHVDVSRDLFDFVEYAVLSQQGLEGSEFAGGGDYLGNLGSSNLL